MKHAAASFTFIQSKFEVPSTVDCSEINCLEWAENMADTSGMFINDSSFVLSTYATM